MRSIARQARDATAVKRQSREAKLVVLFEHMRELASHPASVWQGVSAFHVVQTNLEAAAVASASATPAAVTTATSPTTRSIVPVEALPNLAVSCGEHTCPYGQ